MPWLSLGGSDQRRVDESGALAGPDLVRGSLGTSWIYIVGPWLGTLIGVGFEWILRGKPTVAGALAAEGSPGVDHAAPKR